MPRTPRALSRTPRRDRNEREEDNSDFPATPPAPRVASRRLAEDRPSDSEPALKGAKAVAPPRDTVSGRLRCSGQVASLDTCDSEEEHSTSDAFQVRLAQLRSLGLRCERLLELGYPFSQEVLPLVLSASQKAAEEAPSKRQRR
ncbi:unnamed protein product [Effrenium voratum]|uniref:Uncharacterized protein n=1 Tax=Effrenium voratum TaxID=2562239 RepID=A0AA36MUG1_9DINO|nr:unnamed protein product [Effrenium voratum]CAJ1420320.1 unnamed protein product [Effrenium voratum]